MASPLPATKREPGSHRPIAAVVRPFSPVSSLIASSAGGVSVTSCGAVIAASEVVARPSVANQRTGRECRSLSHPAASAHCGPCQISAYGLQVLK